ncbi:hypothetical protein TRFO_07631 [Tritrichomonas foetus]|uniref:Protein kinase domain-containing protein n=1 Tax=Tritrichomonas foetus TaxID=1144522 RepID=A0A1J4JRK6_9EUKA|nr:hypothetical protein TRFO_07631 [Tritrichomonas foetus]|eukprot:OHT01378.1 hypothetical protein TRFO_07631 [Tritrichomonas foetus]
MSERTFQQITLSGKSIKENTFIRSSGEILGFPLQDLVCISCCHYNKAALYSDGTVRVSGFSPNPKTIRKFTSEKNVLLDDLPKVVDLKSGDDFILFLCEGGKVLIKMREEGKSVWSNPLRVEIDEPACALFGQAYPWIVGESGTIYKVDIRQYTIQKFSMSQRPRKILSFSRDSHFYQHKTFLIDNDGYIYKLDGYSQFIPYDLIPKNSDNVLAGGDHHLFIINNNGNIYVIGTKYFSRESRIQDMAADFLGGTNIKINNITDLTVVEDEFIICKENDHFFSIGKNSFQKFIDGDKRYTSSFFSNREMIDCIGFKRFGDTILLQKSGPPLEKAGIRFLNSKAPDISENTSNLSETVSFSTAIDHFTKKIKILKNNLKLKNEEDHQTKIALEYLKNEMRLIQNENERKDIEIKALRTRLVELEEKLHQQNPKIPSIQYINNIAPKPITLFTQEEINKFTIIKRIGKSVNSKVFQVSSNNHPQNHFQVLKILSIFSKNEENSDSDDESEIINGNEHTIDMERVKRFLCEYEIMSNIDHPNILKTLGFCYGDSKHPPSLLLEYCPTNLKKAISKLTNQEKNLIIQEICLGMKHVHKNNIIHRDLKPENILLDQNNHVKISDFGIATIFNESDEEHTSNLGTLKYMSPEQLNGSQHYNEKVDVYAFGVIVFFILTNGTTPQVSIGDVAKGKKIKIPSTINDFLKNIMESCFSYHPDDRPSFSSLCDQILSNHSQLLPE